MRHSADETAEWRRKVKIAISAASAEAANRRMMNSCEALGKTKRARMIPANKHRATRNNGAREKNEDVVLTVRCFADFE